MSSAEVQQACETTQAPPPETEQIKANHSNLASKPTSKQPKGIMGMFANKNVSKSQDSSKEIKLEQKEDAPVVCVCVSLVSVYLCSKLQDVMLICNVTFVCCCRLRPPKLNLLRKQILWVTSLGNKQPVSISTTPYHIYGECLSIVSHVNTTIVL